MNNDEYIKKLEEENKMFLDYIISLENDLADEKIKTNEYKLKFEEQESDNRGLLDTNISLSDTCRQLSQENFKLTKQCNVK